MSDKKGMDYGYMTVYVLELYLWIGRGNIEPVSPQTFGIILSHETLEVGDIEDGYIGKRFIHLTASRFSYVNKPRKQTAKMFTKRLFESC